MTETWVLHNYWRSSASYRVRIALGLAGVAYEYRAVNLIAAGGGEQQSAAYRAKNPMAQVPTLEVRTPDTTHYLTQSLPIIEFIHERRPEIELLPSDRWARAQARALAEIVNAGVQPMQNLTTMAKVKALGADDRAWAQEFIERGLAAFAASCAPWAGRFCVGDKPTIADCALIPQLGAARRFGASLAGLTQLLEIEAACLAVPAIAAAAPEQQPDAVAT